MAREAIPIYRFGDLLALARQSWTRQMAHELAQRGYSGYRISDAAAVRLLLRGPVAVGQLGEGLGVTRQAARKVARYLEQRGYATSESDRYDARKVNVVLTKVGRAYARAVVESIVSLNRSLAERVDLDQLVAADTVLRTALDDDQLKRRAQQIPVPVDHRTVEHSRRARREHGR